MRAGLVREPTITEHIMRSPEILDAPSKVVNDAPIARNKAVIHCHATVSKKILVCAMMVNERLVDVPW